jgi:hypothetical protein
LGAVIHKQFEKSFIVLQLSFSVLLFQGDRLTPKISDNSRVLERIAAAKLPEHAECTGRDTPHSNIADTLNVYNTME